MITIAICTWNRAKLLDRTLAAMRRLEVPKGLDWEILVVDNACTDDTGEVVASHASRLPVRALRESRKGKSNAANLAMDAADGDLILWTDDDVLVEPDWLARFADAADRHPEAAVFGGAIEPWFPEAPDPDLIAAFPALANGFCGLDHGGEEGPLAPESLLWGANMGFRRSAVAGIRFDSTLGPSPRPLKSKGKTVHLSVGGGEEVQFIRSVRERGGEVVWVPSMKVRHYVAPERMSLEYLTSVYVEAGRLSIRYSGVPTGPHVLGTPRWLLRRWFEARIRSTACRWYSRRAEGLTWLRQSSYYKGMIQECRAAGPRRMAGG